MHTQAHTLLDNAHTYTHKHIQLNADTRNAFPHHMYIQTRICGKDTHVNMHNAYGTQQMTGVFRLPSSLSFPPPSTLPLSAPVPHTHPPGKERNQGSRSLAPTLPPPRIVSAPPVLPPSLHRRARNVLEDTNGLAFISGVDDVVQGVRQALDHDSLPHGIHEHLCASA